MLRAQISAKTVLVLHYLINGCHEIMLYDLLQGNNLNPNISSTNIHDIEPSPNTRKLHSSYSSGLPLTHPIASLPHPQFGVITSIHCHYYSTTIFYEFNNLSDPCSVYRAIVRRNSQSGLVELSFDQLCKSSITGIDLNVYDIRQFTVPNVTQTVNIPMIMFAHYEVFDKKSLNADSSNIGTENFIKNGNMSSNNSRTSFKVPSSGSISTMTSLTSMNGVNVASKYSIVKNKPRPCLAFMYSSFGVSVLPTFSIFLLSWCKLFDGIVVLINSQGGSECNGRVWHTRGHKKNKKNAVEDVISVLEYLVSNNFTSPQQLAIVSGSIGGFVASLVGIKRPDLMSAIVIEDGIFDVLSHPKRMAFTEYEDDDSTDDNTESDSQSHQSSINVSNKASNRFLPEIEDDSAWIDEIGDFTSSPEEFQRLSKISPLQHAENLFFQSIKKLDSSESGSATNIGTKSLKPSRPAIMMCTCKSKLQLLSVVLWIFLILCAFHSG